MAIYGIGAGVVRGEDGRYRQAVVGRIRSRGEKKPKTHHKEGIKCREKNFGTILSCYNPGDYCGEHEEIEVAQFLAAEKLKAEKVKKAKRARNKRAKKERGKKR